MAREPEANLRSATASEPDEQEVLSYFERLSNWGRWGAEDRLGTLNLITPEKALQGCASVQQGRVVSCARAIDFATRPRGIEEPVAPLHLMQATGEAAAEGDGFTSDWVGLPLHGLSLTHLDAHAHALWNGRTYNDQPASAITAARGAGSGPVHLAAQGVVSRGVLLDVARARGVEALSAGARVSAQDLSAAERLAEVELQPGDVALVRTGSTPPANVPLQAEVPVSGLTASALPWLRERDVAVLMTDTGTDALPSPYARLSAPVHSVAIVAIGLWIVDNCLLDALAEACAEARRWSFLLMLAPLALKRCTGSPVNPIAVL